MKEFEAKVRLNEENGGKTGELDIMLKPPFDNGYFKGVTYGITFKEPVFEAGKSEWIPCSERLPEEDGKYLVCWCGAWGVDICFAEYSKSGKYWHEKYGGEYRGITAWMPLPEPYKQEDEHGS